MPNYKFLLWCKPEDQNRNPVVSQSWFHSPLLIKTFKMPPIHQLRKQTPWLIRATMTQHKIKHLLEILWIIAFEAATFTSNHGFLVSLYSKITIITKHNIRIDKTCLTTVYTFQFFFHSTTPKNLPMFTSCSILISVAWITSHSSSLLTTRCSTIMFLSSSCIGMGGETDTKNKKGGEYKPKIVF